jgi:chloride channel protein, CIC family
VATNDSPPDLGGAEYLRLVGLGAVIGIPAAFLAAVFLAFVRDLEHWLWDSLPSALGHASPPWYLVIGLPIAGACVVVVARLLLPGDGGHRPLEGIGGGATPVSHGPGIALAAIGTLSFGAVLGPEAPLIALGRWSA